MSVRFAAAGDHISYTGPMPAGFTIAGWVRCAVDRDDYSTFCRLRTEAEATAVTWSTDSDGTSGPAAFTTAGSIVQSTGLAVGEWRYVVLSRTAGGDAALYVSTADGDFEIDTGTISTAVPAGITLGGRGPFDSSEPFDGAVAYWRMWSAVLSDVEELEAERSSPDPVRTADLWAAWPLVDHTDLTDHSGGGHHFTAGSVPATTEDDPPVSTTVEGALAGVLPALVGSLSGQLIGPGALAGSLPPLTAHLAGDVAVTGQLGASLPALVAQMHGGQGSISGELAAVLPAVVAGLTGTAMTTGELTAVLPALRVQLAQTPPRGEARPVTRAAAAAHPIRRATATMRAGA